MALSMPIDQRVKWVKFLQQAIKAYYVHDSDDGDAFVVNIPREDCYVDLRLESRNYCITINNVDGSAARQ